MTVRVPIFTRKPCEHCKDTPNQFRLETHNLGSWSERVISGAKCKVCQGFGYVLERTERATIEKMKQINSGLASYLKGLIKVHGLGRIAEGCGIDKELLELLATREKRSCTTEVYQKITELMAMDHSRLRKDEKE